MIKFDGKKTGIFAAGVAFGTAGIKILTSKDAKKLYTNCTCLLYTSPFMIIRSVQVMKLLNAKPVWQHV